MVQFIIWWWCDDTKYNQLIMSHSSLSFRAQVVRVTHFTCFMIIYQSTDKLISSDQGKMKKRIIIIGMIPYTSPSFFLSLSLSYDIAVVVNKKQTLDFFVAPQRRRQRLINHPRTLHWLYDHFFHSIFLFNHFFNFFIKLHSMPLRSCVNIIHLQTVNVVIVVVNVILLNFLTATKTYSFEQICLTNSRRKNVRQKIIK